jgi:hypothetical protein
VHPYGGDEQLVQAKPNVMTDRECRNLEVIALEEVVEVVRLLEVVKLHHLLLEALEEALIEDVTKQSVREGIADGLIEGGLHLGHRRLARCILGVEDDLRQCLARCCITTMD